MGFKPVPMDIINASCQSSFTTYLQYPLNNLQKEEPTSNVPYLKTCPLVLFLPPFFVRTYASFSEQGCGGFSRRDEPPQGGMWEPRGNMSTSHYLLWQCEHKVGWENQPHKDMGKQSCPGAARRRREKWGWDMKTWHAWLFGSAGTMPSH